MEHRIPCLRSLAEYGPVTPAKLVTHEVPQMIYFKSCQRCSGDRSLEQDMHGWYVICLSCGFVTYPDIEAKQKEAAAASRTA